MVALMALAAAAAAGQEAPAASMRVINGTVKFGNTAVPGVTIVIWQEASGRKVVTSTDSDGAFSAVVPGDGHWVVRASMLAFAAATKEVVIDGLHPTPKVEIQLTLLSRVPTPEQRRQQMAAARQGLRRLQVTEEADASDITGASDTPLPGMPALSASADAGNDSVAYNGNAGTTQGFARNFDELRDRVQALAQSGQVPGQGLPAGGGLLSGLGGPGGPGGMGGGFGGRGGRGFNANQLHGSLFYSIDDSALDASPYSLSGVPAKPGYSSSRFGAALGGPLRIPKVYDDGGKTFFFVTMYGTRQTQPYEQFSRVPTTAERDGDFSQTLVGDNPVQIFNPSTGQPFLGSTIPQSMISPAAQALLQYIPLPNQPGTQNYRSTGSALNDTTTIGLRLIHNFGAPRQGRRGPGFRSRNNVSVNLNYNGNNADVINSFPTLGGKTKSQGASLNVSDSLTHGKWTNRLSFNLNQQNTHTSNEFSGVENAAALAGITGVSQDPADFGVPHLSFSDVTPLTDITPLLRRTRVFQLTDMAFWNRGKHSVRLGGDVRRMLTRLRNNTDPNGTFTFTGFATSQLVGGQPVPGTGYDFADFLLGLPQQTAIQYSPYTYNFAAIGYDGFVQDSWRMRSNLTVQLGLRYEYVSPYSEADNHIANLEFAPGLTSVVPVLPGQVGLNGVASSALVKPDRYNFAPRIGIAWKLRQKIVVRTGYGINYNLGQYLNMVQQLAYQPPFSVTATNTAPALPLTLANGFPTSTAAVTNNYAVNPNYRLGYVQLWNLNLQYELSPTLLLNMGYQGSKGTHLDIVEAPNRSPSGLLNPSVQPFLFETSAGDSIFHAGTVSLRKRMTHGMSIGGTYTFSKSIDNASSIGGTAVVVAQNPLDLAAERGLSSFDVRHKFTGNYLYELPFGTAKRWLDSGGALAQVFGNWTWSGDFTIQSGSPYTAQILGAYTEVEQGANGSLRANYNGQPIQLSNPSVLEWFNTGAFTIPVPGQFGNAGRNTIIGPGEVLFDMAMTKTFPIKEMKSFEVRLAASNVFNTAHFTSINTVVGSPVFGQVTSVGAMRQLQILARFRF